MSNSSLVSYTDLSENTYGKRTSIIDTISIHCMAGQLSVETCGKVFHERENASSNYGIGPDGRIAMYVEEGNGSICTSNKANDMRAVTIEVASDTTSPYAVNDAAYNSLILLVTDICQRNGIDELKWQGNPDLIGQIDQQNMTVHRWFSNKSCPGDYLYNKHPEIVQLVNGNLRGNYTPAVEEVESEIKEQTNPSFWAGNSSLVTYVNRLSSGNSSPRPENISRITIHIARAVGDIHDLSRMINSSESLYNYGIDNIGTVGLYADETLWTNSCGTSAKARKNDSKSVNIICMNSTIEPDYKISDECYSALLNLVEDICRRHFIFELKYSGNYNKDNLTLHSEFDKKSDCPGPYLTSKMKDIAETINSRINAKYGPNFVQVSARLAKNEAESIKAQSVIAVKSIKPYVIQPSPKMLGLNYYALKQLGVVGTMIDAGERYNDKHELVKYRTETVYKQTLEAKDGFMPHGYIYTTHARTVDEVKEEAYWFHFVVSKYPPKLGVWLRCQFDVKKSNIPPLIAEWYAFFVDWGLKSKCGLYATKKQAAKINWPDQCAYMPLWLEGEYTDAVCPDEELLTPSFFKLGDLKNYSEYQLDLVAPSGPERYTGQPSEKKEEKAVVKESLTGSSIKVPKEPKYTGFKSYSGYQSVTNKSTLNYEITHSNETTTDEKGFRVLDGRFLIVVGSGVCTTIGTYIDIVLENGTVIEGIMGDSKSDRHTDSTNHIFSTSGSYCCSGFIVDNQSGVLDDTVRRMGDCSYRQDDWKSPVKEFKVSTKNWFAR